MAPSHGVSTLKESQLARVCLDVVPLERRVKMAQVVFIYCHISLLLAAACMPFTQTKRRRLVAGNQQYFFTLENTQDILSREY